MSEQTILDMCCGSMMFWFDKQDPRAVFSDIRSESHTLCDGRALEIKPDVVADFRNLPFDNESFNLVVFDPPHLDRCGPNGWHARYNTVGGGFNEKRYDQDVLEAIRAAGGVVAGSE